MTPSAYAPYDAYPVPNMALRNSKLFLVIAWSLIAMSIASFVLRVVIMVLKGHGSDVYRNAKAIPLSYGSALVVIVAVVIVLLIGLVGWIWRRLKNHSRVRRTDDKP